jgi:hypothetical protein
VILFSKGNQMIDYKLMSEAIDYYEEEGFNM